MVTNKTGIVHNNYFKVHFFAIKLFGISILPIEKSIPGVLYKIYCTAIFTITYIYFPIAEILYLVYNVDLENFTSGITYICSHTLGEYDFQVNNVYTYRTRHSA